MTACVPDLCAILPLLLRPTCCALKEEPVTFCRLYAGSSIFYQLFPLITQGTYDQIQSEVTWLFSRVGFVSILPYCIVITVLCIVLARAEIISVEMAIMLTLLTWVISIICISWILFYTEDIIVDTVNNVQAIINKNWEEHGDTLVFRTLTAYLTGSPACPGAEACSCLMGANACTGDIIGNKHPCLGNTVNTVTESPSLESLVKKLDQLIR